MDERREWGWARAKTEDFFRGRRWGWRSLRFMGAVPINPTTSPFERVTEKPICVGVTCWFWERRERTIAQVAERLGVTLQITQQIRGLRREIECQVSGKNVDRFIGEFVRHC